MTNAKQRRGNVLALLAAGAAVLLYVFAIYLPAEKSMRTMREEITSKTRTPAEAGNLAAQFALQQKALEETKAYVSNWQKQAPTPADLPQMLGEMSEMAQAAGVAVTRMEPEPAVHFAELSQSRVSMGCQGSFAEVFDFLRRLESLSHAVWIDNLQIEQAAGNKGDASDVTCMVKLAIFTNKSESSG